MSTFNYSPSSSSSVSTGGWTHDVFLSFRGEDTRYTFVDHLYAALVRRGIRVFKDDEMLHRGKLITPELTKAIEKSRCVVVVFSKNYVDSSWCLVELAKIMECQNRMGRLVLPVFYHVDPSDLRGQRKNFKTAFRQHQQKFRKEMDKVNDWREALTAAANLSGYHILETIKEGESAVTNKIVEEILRNIQPRGMEKNLIDIESRINELNSLLDTEATKEVRMVGILGMGGIGKTTIAQALFRRISYKFEGSSFVKDVRENSSTKRDICALQEKILKDILMTHHESMSNDPKFGAEMIHMRLCNKKVLLVLDDVDDAKQLDFLAATCEWFGAGSRIIITTRDKHLLLDTYANYKPALLVHEQGVELFNRHAFRRPYPPEGYKELSNRAVSHCGGLPLALEVLGSFFRGREARVWESALNRLAKSLDEKIFAILNISFEGLKDSEKNIFLDIACFFKGYDEERVTRVLDSFGFDPVIGISVLIEKSLITVSYKRLDMHDLVQEMGLKIVRESSPISRLWKFEDIHDFTKKKKKLKLIEAIVVQTNYCYDGNMGLSCDVFENMKNLRLLDIRWKFTSSEPTSLPDELQWLRWDHYPFSSLPIENMYKLVGFEITFGNIEHLWMGKKVMPCLKFIHLEGLDFLERFPDVSGAPNVESLILLSCSNLVEVHESLGSHTRLVYLNMSSCSRLKRLPSRIEMPLLENLDLSNCCNLEKFPEVSPSMVKLSNIYLDGCKKLKGVPNSICELHYLKSLHLDNCTELRKLPEDLGSMENLEELWLGFSDYYTALDRPRESLNFYSFTNLCHLRKLDLSWRQMEDEEFPNYLHEFSSLEELHLSGNSKLVQLPASISLLSRLKHLELNDCRRLQNFHALPSKIQVLRASNCPELEKIGDLTKEYVWLYKIWLPGCKKLLENQENERCLNKMLQQSFLKKCAAVDRRLSIAIPGSKIPSWFKEQHGYQIQLKLRPKCRTEIMGFAVCGVFQQKWLLDFVTTSIHFGIENSKRLFLKSIVDEPKVDYIDASVVAENGNVWIAYIPFSFFQQQMVDDFEGNDWSLFDEGYLTISIMIRGAQKVERCGAHVVYKEDVESTQQIKTCIPDYRNSDNVLRYDNTFVYREELRTIDHKLPVY